MLAMGRALMSRPKLLLLDEPSLGLAPALVKEIFRTIRDISSGGTVARWACEGRQVHYVLCTSGNRGSDDPEMTPERLGEIREAEQRAAAEVLGVAGLTFLRHEDCELEETLAFRHELSILIRTFRPDVLVTHDPWARYRIHPDHRAVGFTALAAIVIAGNRMYRDGPPPHAVGQVYLFQTDNPFLVDITRLSSPRCRRFRAPEPDAHSGEMMLKRARVG
jgi:LmbE family N-acetylglucosaminyl deacetylase